MIKKCKKCGRMIKYINIGTYKKPNLVEDKVDGFQNDVFCGYCATTCFFINGNMYTLEEAIAKETASMRLELQRLKKENKELIRLYNKLVLINNKAIKLINKQQRLLRMRR